MKRFLKSRVRRNSASFTGMQKITIISRTRCFRSNTHCKFHVLRLMFRRIRYLNQPPVTSFQMIVSVAISRHCSLFVRLLRPLLLHLPRKFERSHLWHQTLSLEFSASTFPYPSFVFRGVCWLLSECPLSLPSYFQMGTTPQSPVVRLFVR